MALAGSGAIPLDKSRMTRPIEFRQGAIELLILKTLSWGPQHGFSIARWIQDTTSDVLRLEEGSLYPTLHRLEDKAWVESRWGTSENNRKARFYRLTRDGRKQLHLEAKSWEETAAIVGRFFAVKAEDLK